MGWASDTAASWCDRCHQRLSAADFALLPGSVISAESGYSTDCVLNRPKGHLSMMRGYRLADEEVSSEAHDTAGTRVGCLALKIRLLAGSRG
jgi:hypothetical protein